jgi:hypothetical protein
MAIVHRWGPDANGRLERFIIVLNFSASQTLDIPFSVNGDWQDLLNGGSLQVADFWARDQTIASHWGRVLFHLS